MSEIQKVYLVLWENTWGEYHGCYGVYTTIEKANIAKWLCREDHGNSWVVRTTLDPTDNEGEFDT